jgi:hypothetical protein
MAALIDRIRHFYFNKYFVTPFSSRRYFVSYCFKHKALWYRVYKVGTRTIDQRIKDDANGNYIYSSAVGYRHQMYSDFFKFAFVRNPVDRFVSGWKDKVLNQNYYNFNPSKHEEMKDLDHFITWVEQFDLEHCDEHLRAQYAIIDTNHVDFIGRFERFEDDFKIVADRIGLKDYSMEKLNASGSKQLTIASETEQRIIRLYEKDARLFYPSLLDKLD